MHLQLVYGMPLTRTWCPSGYYRFATILVDASSLLPLRGDRLLLQARLFYLLLASPPVESVGEVTAAGFPLLPVWCVAALGLQDHSG